MPVRDHSKSHLMTNLTVWRVQMDFVTVGSTFAYSISFLSKYKSDSSFSSHSIEIVLHSVLACRLMIGIREATQSCGRKSETFELSEVPNDNPLEFARRFSEDESA